MLQHIDITGIHYEVDDITKKYIMKKIGRLDRFVSRHGRKSVKAEVVIRQVNRPNGNKYECEVNFVVPGKVLNATDSTMNALAAVDIVEAKLSEQLRKYKDANAPQKGWRARLARRRQEKAANRL